MARVARQESSTGLYHVVMRGNNRQWIFKDDNDKQAFIKFLKQEEKEERIALLAWCVMDNHVHLVLKSELKDMMQAMKKMNIKFAMRYNSKHKSVGHVFQDRFKSQAIEDDAYLMQVIRYVHNNPVKAGIVDEIDTYKWSSYPLYISGKITESQNQMVFVLEYFDHKIEQLKKFHMKTDYNDYLDIEEDKERHQNAKVEKILKEIYETYGVRDGHEMISNHEIKEKLIEEMIFKSGMSLRKIAKYLEISYNSVQAVSQRMGE